MTFKRILLVIFAFIYFSISLFAMDVNEYYSSVAISDDGEYMCIATVHHHKVIQRADGTWGEHDPDCKDKEKESIWIAATRDWRKQPYLVYTFETPGWSHPTVCYDKENDSFLVYHRSDDPMENGFFEFYRSEKTFPDYKHRKFTPFSSKSGSGVLYKNEAGIYLVQDNNVKWPISTSEWLVSTNHFSKIYKIDLADHNVTTTYLERFENIKIMGVPLERKETFKTIQDIQPVFPTKNGLILRDYNRINWWYYNCLEDTVKKFSSQKEAQTYDDQLEKQRTIDSLLPEIKERLASENFSTNQSEDINKTISKAISESLPDNLPETIAETISQVLAAALYPPVSVNTEEGIQNQVDDSINQELQDSISNSALELETEKETPDHKIQSNLIILPVILSLLLLIAIAIIILLKKKQKKSFKNGDQLEISRLVYQTQEQERASVSRDIHDSVVQDMRGIRLETELLNVKEDSILRQKKIEEMATDCVVKLRNICYNLTPAELTTNNNNVSSKFELVSILQTLAQQFTERTKIPCSVKVADGFKYSTYSKEISLNVFRVVQEALNNIEKHSYATNTSIYMQSDNNKMKIFITDDGIGFDTNVTQIQDDGLIHFGVQMMKDRMNLIGGSIKFISGNNDGTEIQLEFGE